MGKATKYILIGVFMVIGGLVASYFGLIALFRYDLSSEHVIATDVSISDAWTEIVPESPMKVEKQTQQVYLEIKEYKHDTNQSGWVIKLPDGRVVKPELELLDEHGNTFVLSFSIVSMPTGKKYHLVGFTPKEIHAGSTFPADRVYTKLRIRSDEPFSCSKIIWSNKKLK